MAKAKTAERTARVAGRPPKALAPRATIANSDVASRAYDLYLGRDREDGHDVEDWLQAERELQSASPI